MSCQYPEQLQHFPKTVLDKILVKISKGGQVVSIKFVPEFLTDKNSKAHVSVGGERFGYLKPVPKSKSGKISSHVPPTHPPGVPPPCESKPSSVHLMWSFNQVLDTPVRSVKRKTQGPRLQVNIIVKGKEPFVVATKSHLSWKHNEHRVSS